MALLYFWRRPRRCWRVVRKQLIDRELVDIRRRRTTGSTRTRKWRQLDGRKCAPLQGIGGGRAGRLYGWQREAMGRTLLGASQVVQIREVGRSLSLSHVGKGGDEGRLDWRRAPVFGHEY